MDAALYLLPVPIGEVEADLIDMVLPAHNREVIAGIRHYIVENARTARRFLRAAGIGLDGLAFYELNKHTAPEDVAGYLAPLEAQGLPMGVLSEAGCPAVADPGADVVALAHRRGLRVVPLVGPSSLVLAVMASGFNGQSFAFNGYLPVRGAERAARIRQLESRSRRERQTQLFIEAPYRNHALLAALLESCAPDTRLCVAAGLTGADEYVRTRTIAEWRRRPLPEIDRVPAVFLLYAA